MHIEGSFTKLEVADGIGFHLNTQYDGGVCWSYSEKKKPLYMIWGKDGRGMLCKFNSEHSAKLYIDSLGKDFTILQIKPGGVVMEPISKKSSKTYLTDNQIKVLSVASFTEKMRPSDMGKTEACKGMKNISHKCLALAQKGLLKKRRGCQYNLTNAGKQALVESGVQGSTAKSILYGKKFDQKA